MTPTERYSQYCAAFHRGGITPLSFDLWQRAVDRPHKATPALSDTAQDIETERREGWTYGER